MKRILSMALVAVLMSSVLTVGAHAEGGRPTLEEARKNFNVSINIGGADDLDLWVETPLVLGFPDEYYEEPEQIKGYNAVTEDALITVENTGSAEDYVLTVSASTYTHAEGNLYEWDIPHTLANKGFINGALDPDVPEYGGLASPAVGESVEFTLPLGDAPDTKVFQMTVHVGYPEWDYSYYYNYDFKYDANKVAEALAQGKQVATITTEPTASRVLVNGKETAFDAYTIDDNNYFKIRDIASALNGTGKQFDIAWDDALSAISMTSNRAYTPVGGELAAGDGKSKTATVNTANVYVDGKEVSLSAYTISGNNYVKLRDLGQLFDFGVRWENAIVIDTSTGYTEANAE